ncbi:peptide ligase PGM1-related protein [Frankia sp. CiP3]|uniref:peptide ligase PGM1-related protein n=1 Tax=Frankia sp. CiP3 TaxID=2880971 RepID=UPI001EF41B8C|nr:peptide ligase PGM1-related protein [Frankia sp. CiP3]
MDNSPIFDRLQNSLGAILGAADAEQTVIVVPSLTLHPDELAKIPGVMHFEERLLFMLSTLTQPATRVIYVTSEALDPAVVEYAFDLVPSLPRRHARQRLTLLDCADPGPTPLTEKILASPDQLDRLRRSVPARGRAHLVTYVSTPLEQSLAVALGMPLYACDPALSEIGGKSGSRTLLRDAGVPVPAGVEGVRTEADLVAALATVKAADRATRSAIVKLNDSFAGGGNAVFSFEGGPNRDLEPWIRSELPRRLTVASPADTWETYGEKLLKMGGIVERFIDSTGTVSPSVQLEITPGTGARVVSTHDQILGGPSGQMFLGCVFPAHPAARRQIQALALRAGKALADRGVLGHLSIDFVVEPATAGGACHALEINLRMGGATAPTFLLRGLVQGEFDEATGEYRTPEGAPRCYQASDRVQNSAYRGLTPDDVLDTALRAGLLYSNARRTGVAFYMLGALADVGKLGLVAIETDPGRAELLYHRTIAALDGRAAPGSHPPAGPLRTTLDDTCGQLGRDHADA